MYHKHTSDDVHHVRRMTTEMIKNKFPEVFDSAGDLKDRQITLHVDPTIQPVAQSGRRLPFLMRPKVKKEILRLINVDEIEEVTEPTPWVSPIVVVPKHNKPDEVRICMDMRCVNEAIKRERYPILTIDEVSQDLDESPIFSKLDMRWGYHQIALAEESCNLTTFVKCDNMYRYKRLVFGVNPASEIYQKEV